MKRACKDIQDRGRILSLLIRMRGMKSACINELEESKEVEGYLVGSEPSVP